MLLSATYTGHVLNFEFKGAKFALFNAIPIPRDAAILKAKAHFVVIYVDPKYKCIKIRHLLVLPGEIVKILIFIIPI